MPLILYNTPLKNKTGGNTIVPPKFKIAVPSGKNKKKSGEATMTLRISWKNGKWNLPRKGKFNYIPPVGASLVFQNNGKEERAVVLERWGDQFGVVLVVSLLEE